MPPLSEPKEPCACTRSHLSRSSVLLLLAIAAGCAEPTRFEPGSSNDRLGAWAPDGAATFLRAAVSGLDNPTLAVVSDRSAWQDVWTRAWAGIQEAPPLPQVDFVLNSVLVVGLGRRAGQGYSVAIDSFVVHTTYAVLYATVAAPGAGCPGSSGVSTAVHMVHAPGHPPITEWRIAEVRRGCGP